ncbi:viral A-type inclusion protein [Tritrichomonas foetus]|uniref:Viral A-type inclusion protein n=1 Tax=Tritrichomonas foetus TaxID=1144522 RepID=A0A1J4K2N1_9EUKA|nr:viral A-type inclusion protein [Tritrichomonas foetus]|eukprot:OHT03990.1 viral A-type inclusion protein [Tritrichomonas foetus]
MDLSQFEELGQNLLESFHSQSTGSFANINSSNSSSNSTQNANLYHHLVELSQKIEEYHLNIDSHDELPTEKYLQLSNLIATIMNDLSLLNSTPDLFLNVNSSIQDAYKILAFSLYVLQNCAPKSNNLINSDISEASLQNDKLKNDLDDLQKHYDSLLQNSLDSSSLTHYYENAKNAKKELKKEIDRLLLKIDQYEEMERETGHLIAYLKNHFNLADSTNLHNVIDAINIKSTVGISEEDRIEHLNYTNIDLENRLILLQQEKDELEAMYKEQQKKLREEISQEAFGTNAKIFVLENDINALQVQVKELSNKIEEKKNKISTLKNKLNEKDSKYKDFERKYELLKLQYDKLSIENDDKKHNQNDSSNTAISSDIIKNKDIEISNLHAALTDLTNQMELMSEDLKTESNIKNNLFVILQKQNNGFAFSEQVIKDLENELQKQKLENNSGFVFKIKKDDNIDEYNQQIIQSIKAFIYENLPENEGLSIMLDCSDLDIISKILRLMSHLINLNKRNEKSINIQKQCNPLNNEIGRLLTYLHNMLHFMEQVANSGDIQKFFLEKEPISDFRDELLAQCARIETFLEENGIMENYQTINDNFLDFSNYSAAIEEQLKNPDVDELIFLIRQSSFINDVFRRLADDWKQQSERLISDIKVMRYQLNEANETFNDRVSEKTESLTIELENEKKKNQDIQKIHHLLRKAAVNDNPNDSIISKCLCIIQRITDGNNLNNPNNNTDVDDENNDDIEYNDFNADFYLKKIENKLAKEMAHREEIEYNANSIINKLKNKIKSLNKQIDNERKQFLSEVESTKQQFEELSQSITENDESNAQVKNKLEEKEKEIESLTETIRRQKEQITKLQELKDQEKEMIRTEIQKENEKVFKEKEDTIGTLTLSLENVQAEAEEKYKQMKQDLKTKIKKLEAEVEIENQRANDLRNHFESLLADVKKKLLLSRETENDARNKLVAMENELKETKSALSKIRIDYKMLNLKVSAAEDKLNRERSLFDTQLKMKILGMQTDHQTQIDELKDEYENNLHKLLVNICEQFKDYLDFDLPISEELVINILKQVSMDLNIAKEKNILKQNHSEIVCEIRTLLNIKNEDEIIKIIRQIVKDAAKYSEYKTKIDENKKQSVLLTKKAKFQNTHEKISHEWEVWAKRLHSMITDSFSTAKTYKQLQYAIEEALMSAIGQRQAWRKLEILRTEKSLLASGVKLYPKNHKSSSNTSFLSLIGMSLCLYRMQKLSGHLKYHPNISSKDSPKEPPIPTVKDNPFPQKKHFPIISYITE